jgi:small-conductance mechanosensitive channel
VPNQKFITDNVTNDVHCGAKIRLRVPAVIAPGQDVRAVERLLLAAASKADVLSRVYFVVMDALAGASIKRGG